MRVCLGLLFAGALLACNRQDAPDAGRDDAGPVDTGLPDYRYDAGMPPGSLIGEVSLMSWNIEQFPKTGTTARIVREIVDDLRPDVIGVQEIAVPQAFEDLVATMPDYEGLQVDDPNNYLRVGMLYRGDRVRVENVSFLFTRDGYAFPRPPLRADVTVTSTQGVLFDFVFIVVHHKARGDTRSRERRRSANQKLDAYIRDQLASGSDRDFVVLGDYNDHLTDLPGDNTFEVFLSDPSLYFFLTRSLVETDSSYVFIPGLIDHVMVTTDALMEYGSGTTRILYLDRDREDYVFHVSDHRPVHSRFRIYAEP